MARQNVPLYSFNQGEVSRLALARVDAAKLRLAAACQVNWQPWTLGPMMLRPGLLHIDDVLSAGFTGNAKLMRFVFGKLDTALLEMTDSVMRVYVSDAVITRRAPLTTISQPNFAAAGSWSTAGTTTGAGVTIGGGVALLYASPIGSLARLSQTLAINAADVNQELALRIVVASGPVVFRLGSTAGGEQLITHTTLEVGTHSLAFTPTGANAFIQFDATVQWRVALTQCSIESAGAMQLPTPWTATDLDSIRYDQSGDVIFVACKGRAPYRIERRATRSWSVVSFKTEDGPFSSGPLANVSLSVSAAIGDAVTMTANLPYFEAGHVGALFRLFTNGQNYNPGITLGAENAFMPAFRVIGVGTPRNFTWTVSGVWVGTISLMRSYDGPDSGFQGVATTTVNGTFTENTGGTAGTPDLDNVVVWYKIGFTAGAYTSGNAVVSTTYGGGGAFGVVRVTGYSSPTSVTANVELPISQAGAPTYDWQEGAWSAASNGTYPCAVCIHEGRLWWFAEDQIWGSRSNNYVSYAQEDHFGEALGDSGAIIARLGSGPVDTIPWGISVLRLLIGREQSVDSARSSSFDQPLTPSAFSVKSCSTNGADRLPPVKIDQRAIYVQQSHRRVFELAYDFGKQDYASRDMTRLNIDIGKPGFIDVDVMHQPDDTIFFVRNDGQVAVLLDNEDEEVVAWWRLQTLGTVENVCVLPSDSIEDNVYFIVRRTINGTTRRFIEKLALRDDCTGGLLNKQLDCAYTYSGFSTLTVTVPWLPNTTVMVWADGSYLGTALSNGAGLIAMPDGQAHSNIVVGLGGAIKIGSTNATLGNGTAPDQLFGSAQSTLTVGAAYNGLPCEVFADVGATGKAPIHVGTFTVSAGAISLGTGQVATTIIACIGYVAPFQSAKLAYGAQLGTALNQRKKLDHVGLVMFDTSYQGVKYGTRFDVLDDLPLVEGGTVTPTGTVWAEYDEPMVELSGEWNTDSRLCLLAQAPSPCTIGAVVAGMATNESGGG
jgi:hypothetical protein